MTSELPLLEKLGMVEILDNGTYNVCWVPVLLWSSLTLIVGAAMTVQWSGVDPEFASDLGMLAIAVLPVAIIAIGASILFSRMGSR